MFGYTVTSHYHWPTAFTLVPTLRLIPPVESPLKPPGGVPDPVDRPRAADDVAIHVHRHVGRDVDHRGRGLGLGQRPRLLGAELQDDRAFVERLDVCRVDEPLAVGRA